MKEIKNKRIAKAEEVLEMLSLSMRGEIDEEVVASESDGEGGIKPVILKKQLGARDRIKAAELLGKRYRLFSEKVEVEGVIPIVITGEDELEE